MDVRKTALLAGALVVAIITALLARSMFANAAAPAAAASSSAAPAKASGPKILVATRALPVGTIISADSFRLQPWPDDLIENAYFKDGPDFDANHLIGQVVRTALAAGQPISQGALVKPGDRGFLAAALGPGSRDRNAPARISAHASACGACVAFHQPRCWQQLRTIRWD
jgi:pilus assembly protein CpaB